MTGEHRGDLDSLDGIEIEVERWLPAPPERVWRYFTEADLWPRWQGTGATLEARPGGTLEVALGGGDGTGARGAFLELDPPRRLVFTWGWVGGPLEDIPPGSTTVEVVLEAADGGTRLRLTHRGLPAGLEGMHDEGWRRYLERLVLVLDGCDPGPDPSLTPAPAAPHSPS